MTFTPGSDEGRTDTFEAQTAEPDRSIDKEVKEEFDDAQNILTQTGEALYGLGLAGIYAITKSPDAVQAVNALRRKLEGKPFTPPTPNPNNLGGLVTLEPITTEEAFTRPDVTGTASEGFDRDLPPVTDGPTNYIYQMYGGSVTPEQKRAISLIKAKMQGKDPNEGLEKEDEEEDPNDVPRNSPDTWQTVGQKPQPLNFLFGEKAGWRGGRLNLKSWRERGTDKNIAEQFLTAIGKGVVFGTERNKQNTFMSRVFGIEGAKQLLELPEDAKGIFQAHHNTATKAVLTGQEGLVYDSPYYHEIQKVWEDLELTLGNNPKNIIGTLGLVQRDLNSPHSLIHKFLDSKMGKDGTKFWTPEILNQIVIYDDAGNAIGHKNFDLRVAKTKEQALIFKEAVDLLKLAHRQFYLAKGVKPGEYLTTEPILDEEVVDSFINKLPPKGGTGKYTTNIISKVAQEIANEKNTTPTIKSGSLKQLLAELFAQRRVKKQINQMYKFAVNEVNGEEMLVDVLFNKLTPTQALRKWRKNDPQMKQLSLRFNKALNQAKNPTVSQQLQELDTSSLDAEIRKIDPSGPLDRTSAPKNIQTDIDKNTN